MKSQQETHTHIAAIVFIVDPEHLLTCDLCQITHTDEYEK